MKQAKFIQVTASQEPQTYRINKLAEIEVLFLDETEVPERITRKMK